MANIYPDFIVVFKIYRYNILMDTLKGLDILERLENSLAQMYAQLQKKFSDNDELSAFFYQMHLEEVAHCNLVKMQKRIVRKDLDLFPAIELSIKEIKRMVEIASSIPKLPKDDVAAICKQIYAIESSSAELYVFTALSRSNIDMRSLLLRLGSGFSEHLGMIEFLMVRLNIPFSKVEGLKLRHPRILFSEKVLINDKFTMKSLDISESGMFLITDRKLPLGSKLKLSFPLSRETIEVEGVIQFVDNKKGIGVEFLNMLPEHRIIINNHVHKALESITTKRLPALLVSSTKMQGTNLRLYTNVLLEEGFIVAYVEGFVEAVLFMNSHAHDIENVVISLSSEEDDNLKLLNFIRENEILKHVKVIVLTNNYSKDFKKIINKFEVDDIASIADTTPKKLAAIIKALHSV